jgi:ribosomal protein L11 methyltransferase
LKWIELSITVQDELAEPLAELLGQHVASGVALETHYQHDRSEHNQPTGEVTVRAYLADDDSLPAVRQAIDHGLWHLGRILAMPDATYTPLGDQDWQQVWKAKYQPLPIGERLLILPAWMDPPAGGGREVVRLDPGMAFGTGVHPTTRHCLQVVERRLTPGDRVIDLGCGSGILSLAASRLGAGWVRGYDIDPQAVRVAQDNARLNGLQRRVQFRQGSLAQVQRALRSGIPPADMLLANILAHVLEEMLASGLREAVRPGGLLVLSGILEDQAPPLLGGARMAGLDLIDSLAERDWRSLVLQRNSPPTGSGGE